MGGAKGRKQGKKIKDQKTSSSVIPKQKKRLKYVFFLLYEAPSVDRSLHYASLDGSNDSPKAT